MSTALGHVKTNSSARTTDEVLRGPVIALLGVSDTAASVLQGLQINTVFDLAASRVFAAAADLVAISDGNLDRLENRLNAVPSDVVDAPPGVPVAELAKQPISVLRGIGSVLAQSVSATLDVSTVRDLALWPPYRAANALLADAFFPEQQVGFDIDAPADLLPQSGAYPTERVFYRSLLIDAPPPGGQASPIEDLAAAVDITPGLMQGTGFDALATGALLTFSQSWYAQGLTLGQLLHSTALAPGESTRLAVVDWNRRQRAATTEDVSEAEQLSSSATHNRALSEVTSAVATEVQAGTSSNTVTSSTSDSGLGFGFELGPLAFGGSGGSSSTTTDTMTASSSFGLRNVSADYAQTVNDRTQQNATSVRDRRASTVREVSQDEHSEISTRVITNYNHMHALSVQYYEVVQAFRATTQLEQVERCLFLPVKLIDFSLRATIERWRGALARAALTPAAGRMLAEFGTVLATSQLPLLSIVRPVRTVGGLSVGYLTARALDTGAIAAATLSTETAAAAPSTAADSTPPAGSTPSATPTTPELPEPPDTTAAQKPAPTTRIGRLVAAGWDAGQIQEIGRLMGRLLLPTRTNCVYIPDEALLMGVSLRSGAATQFELKRGDGTLVATQPTGAGVSLTTPVTISELRSIALESAVVRQVRTAITLQLSLFGTMKTLDVPIQLAAGGVGSGLQLCVTFDGGAAMRDLIDHLQANALHYTQAILRSLDGSEVAALLARFSYRGLPLAQLVDQQPVAVTSNFFVFRMNLPATGDPPDPALADDVADWQRFLARTGLDRPVPRSEIIPLPSGGVFGEAVLGRSNAAEQIDLHRFWNWQDSPIPMTPPEIAAVSAESRSKPESVKAGQLSAPVLSVQAPTTLPDPTGIAAVAAAIASSGMFRDMSGLEQAAAIALAAQKASAAGATSAMQQASQNLQTVMDQKTQRMRIAAQLAAQLAGVPISGETGSQTSPGKDTATERGGELNQAKRIDGEQASGAPGAAGKADVFRAQQGLGGQEAAAKLADSAAAPPVDAITGAGAPAAPVRTVGPTQAAPQSILAVLNLSSRFTDTAVFGPTPVQIEATIQDLGGKQIWERKGVANPTFSATLQTTDPRLFLNMWFQYELSWPQPTTVKTNRFVNLDVSSGPSRVDAVAWVFVDDRTFTVDTAPAADPDFVSVLSSNGIALNAVMAKPTVANRPDGKFDVTAKVLRVVMEQLSAPPTHT